MALLRLENLEASYGAVRALQGISMEVKDGAVVSLLGANGAGKSTTLKAISGAVQPTKGRILFDDQEINGLSPNKIVQLGIAQVPEGRKVFKDLTVRENLAMGAYSRRDRRGVQHDFDLVYNLFPRLRERHGQLGGSLSGGEQQMLAIGLGLMARPRLLLLDEPSLGLAPIAVKDIFETLARINKDNNTTLLVVEQNANIALKNASYAYVMRVGRIAMNGPARDLIKDEAVIETYLGVAQ